MKRFSSVLVVLIPMFLFAQQGTFTGTVTSDDGDALVGVNVFVEGTTLGAATDADGSYTIRNVPAGTYTLTASMIGYESVSQAAEIQLGLTNRLDFVLVQSVLEQSGIEVLASRATRTTPVAYSDVEQEDMELRLGSQDIPMVLNLTPSVYATQQGGGAGDARVNIRGFNQRNVAIMINGVPVNDMENGWVYWSNWDGIADATSSIQMQRGLSAVNLATPSIGGTMNILTDPASHERGGKFKQELGDGKFLKTTLTYHTGLVNEKLAAAFTIVRKTGDGIIDKAWTDAWAYYFGLSYTLNAKNRFELYAVGAPQRHGQMRYKQNIAAYDKDLAKDLFDDDIEDAAIGTYFREGKSSRYYNENWNTVSSDYKGKQYFYMYGEREVDRHDPDYLNESENYYHKPQVNFNWFLTLSDALRLSTVFYYSGGSGGGTGTFDDMQWDYSYPTRIADWDATIATNQGTSDRKGKDKEAGQSVAFLRNSINRQWTVGAISKATLELSESLTLQAGLDWRKAEIEHNREVRDLLGGSYAVNGDWSSGKYWTFYNEFDHVYDGEDLDYDATLAKASGKKLGDVINYNNTNTVDWAGFFGQGEFKTDLFSVYGMAGYSMVKYSLIDYFKKYENHVENKSYIKKGPDGEVSIESDWITAAQVKGGGLFNLNDDMSVFANFGLVQKVPILDNVIDDVDIALASAPKNEEFLSFEAGLNLRALSGMLTSKFNVYQTYWNNRTMTKLVEAGAGSSGDTDIIFLTGLNQLHQGVEAEFAFQPMDLVRFDGAISYGNWVFTDDAKGTYKDRINNTTEEFEYAVKDLKVGDMPQTIVALGATVFPVKGFSVQGIFNYFDRHWADWNPLDREIDNGVADREASWQVPSAQKVDLHAKYNLPGNVFGNVKANVFFHVFNVFDEVYVQDALDNSSYNAYTGDGKNHKADDAEVYLSTPRYMNLGVQFNF